MSEKQVVSGAVLRQAVARVWSRLEQALDRLESRAATTRVDAQGWTAADHLHHLALWAEAALAIMDGRPRHQTLSLDRAQFDQGDFDALNEILRGRGPAATLSGAAGRLRALHPRLTAALEGLTEEELWQPCDSFVSGEAGRDAGRPLLALLFANTVHHVEEHLDWIETLTP